MMVSEELPAAPPPPLIPFDAKLPLDPLMVVDDAEGNAFVVVLVLLNFR